MEGRSIESTMGRPLRQTLQHTNPAPSAKYLHELPPGPGPGPSRPEPPSSRVRAGCCAALCLRCPGSELLVAS